MELLNYPAEDGSRERPALQVQISGTSMPKSKSKRNKLYRPRTIKVGPLLIDARHAINAIMDRKESGQTSGYIATGDELKTISEAFAVIIPTLKMAVALSPHTCMKEFDWAKNRANEKLRRKQNEKKRTEG